MKKIYQVVDGGVDGWARNTVGFFESEQDAEAVRDKETSYGQGSIHETEVFDSVADYKTFLKDSAIAKALDKLTNEEKDLLGLK